MNKINKKELKDMMEHNNIVVIEVLEPKEFKKEHIKGAINIPLAEIVSESKERFGFEQDIAVYCSDYDCGASPTAAKKLQNSGFTHVYDFAGGKKEWKEAGYPMES